MSSNKNLNIALRITADLKKALQQMGVFKKSLDDVNQSTRAADASTRKSSAAYSAAAKATAQTASAQQKLKSATDGTTQAWKKTAAAQSAAMNHATKQRNAADAQAAAAARVAAETKKEDAVLQKLVGSLKTTELELQRLDQQQRLLERGFKRGKISADQLAQGLTAIRSKRDALQGISRDAQRANASMQALSGTVRGLRNLLVAGVVGVSVLGVAQDVVKTNLAYQQATYTMQAATGSAAEAAAELAYVRDISEELGLELLSTSQAYARLVASAKNTPELLPYMDDVFEGVSRAATALHLVPSEFNGILLAMEQMVSKGRVQTQELVLQLGQRIPGAYALAADALDTNTAQLAEWLEQGEIAATDFLPRFAEALNEAYGPSSQKAASGLQAEINRLSNAWTQMKINAGEAGFIDSYTTAVRDLTTTLNDPAIQDGFNTLLTGLGKVIELSVEAGAAIANFADGVGTFAGNPQVGEIEELTEKLELLQKSRAAAEYRLLNAGMDPSQSPGIKTLDAAIERTERLLGLSREYALGYDLPESRIREFLEAEVAYFDSIRTRLFAAYEQGNAELQTHLLMMLDASDKRIEQFRARLPDTDGGAGAGEKPEDKPLDPYSPGGDSKDNERFVAQLEKEAATLGKSEAEVRRYEAASRNLTGELKERAQAALAAMDATEKQIAADKQAQQDLETLAALQLDYLEATGQGAAAAAARIEAEYSGLRERLLAQGNEAGADLVGNLIDVEKAKAELDALQAEIERVFSEQSRREQSIQTQQQAGLIGELQARQDIVDLHRQTAEEVEQLLPQMRELAEATGDPAAIERVKDLEAQLVQLRTTANEVALALRNAFETSLANALEGLATGTHSLQEAAQAFVADIGRAVVRLASQNLAAMATDGLAGLFDTTGDAAAASAAASATATAITTASTTGAAAMSTGITTATSTGAASITAAHTSGAATMASTLAASFAAGAAQVGAAISAANATSAVSSVAGVAAATGGHVTGPGTYTSDSIPARLSNWEYVTRAAVVTQPGALNFLHDFNARGMAALDDYARRVRHATGGLAGIPAPASSMPASSSGRLAEPAGAFAGHAQITNRQTFNLIDSPERIADALNTPAGNQAITVMLSRDPAKFRQILGVN